jgi:hypothetical protein
MSLKRPIIDPIKNIAVIATFKKIQFGSSLSILSKSLNIAPMITLVTYSEITNENIAPIA